MIDRPASAAPTQATARLVHVLTVAMTLRFFRGQVQFMKSHGFDLEVVAAPDPELDAFGEQEQVDTWPLPMSRRIAPHEDLHLVYRLYRHLLAARPHIVHGHTPKGGLVAMIAAWLARVPVRIYHVRGLPFETAAGWQRVLLRSTERVSCALASHVLCNSASNRDVLVREGICPAEKVQVLGHGSSNGVDALGRFDPAQRTPAEVSALRDALGIPEKGQVVGFVGRLVRDKGIIELARAWQGLRQQFADLHLVLVGPFESRDAVPAKVRAALERDPRVHLTGFVEDAAAFYPLFDVLAFPSHREGFPNVLLEAAAMEVPVVAAWASGSIDAVCDGETGVLVPVADANALQAALARYLVDPMLRQYHGRAARARVLEYYQPQHIWEALVNVYRDALMGTRFGPSSS